MTQVQHQLDSPTYVISDDKEIREGQEAWSRLKTTFGANPSAKMRCGASATINASKTAIKPARTNIGVFLMFSTIPE
jgi:hypothetical protein